MAWQDVLQIFLFFFVLIVVSPFVGKYISNIFRTTAGFNNNEESKVSKGIFSKIENFLYKIAGINPNEDMNWRDYAKSLLLFNTFGFLFLFLLQIFQYYLPGNPQNLANVGLSLAFNTASSFVTNTNWQSYAGETTLGYLVQMLGLTVQSFLSAATGIAVIIALIRGIKNRTSKFIGNFWVDMTKGTIYILIPLSIFIAILLLSQGVVQNFGSNHDYTTLEGQKSSIPSGLVASQEAIKMVGTNGGGYFNSNSSHPFENPTPFSNFVEMFAILIIPMSLPFAFGKLLSKPKQGRAIFAAMFIMSIIGLAVMMYSENLYNPVLQTSSMMEGKETRFGITNSILFANVTTNVSCGAVNSMHSSLSPLSGMITLLNMMMGEVIFGGVGAGLYGILIFVFLAVFISGLMVGRTPEFMGKKIESYEVKMAMIAVLAPNFVILVFSAITLLYPAALASVSSSGPHGFTEILYAFTSAAMNNGSAFAGLNANTDFFNIMLGLGMLIGRFAVIIPVLAIAGSLSAKKIIPESNGTLRTDSSIFVGLLIVVIVIIGALTHFPNIVLGPISEHFLMIMGKTF